MKIVEIELKEFETFVKKQKMDNFLQSPEMYRRYQKIGKEAYLFGGFIEEKKKLKTGELIAQEKLKVVALCVKMREKLGKKVYNMPRGPIWDDEAPEAKEILSSFLEGVEGILRAKGGMVLQVSPNIWRKRAIDENDKMIEEKWGHGEEVASVLTKIGFKNLGEYEQIKWAYILDLENKSAEDILANFRYSHRRNVRLAKDKYEISIRELGEQELGVLKEITEQTGERRGFKDPDLQYYQDMKEAFGKKVQFLVAEWGGKGAKDGEEIGERETNGKIPVAAAMFLTYGGERIYLFSGSDRRYKKYAGPHLMQWEVIKSALESKVPVYNFYGTHPVELPGEKGVYEFKRGFRGEIIEYVGTFAKPLNLLGKLYLSRINYAKYREMS